MIKKEDCCGCTACKIACPTQCIEMKYDSEGFIYPEINHDKCIECGLCEKVCPFKETKKIKNEPLVYAAFCKDDEIRASSSSGGIFSVLASKIIEQNGIVCGAIFDEKTKKVRHINVCDNEGLDSLRGSKYVQSELGNIFLEIKDNLIKEKKVLFCGTSCQVAGLKTYLRKDYDNLICVELICHGVPSTKLWEKYCNYIENKYNKKITNVKFRNKKYGWLNYGIFTCFSDSTVKFDFSFENSFFRFFNSNLCLRPSCYNCKVKGLNTKADIIIGDFWHIESMFPNVETKKGISMVMICTDKGKALFESILDNIHIIGKDINYRDAYDCNHAIIDSMKKTDVRENFFRDLDSLGYNDLVSKYNPLTLKMKIKGILLRIGVMDNIQKIRRKFN